MLEAEMQRLFRLSGLVLIAMILGVATAAKAQTVADVVVEGTAPNSCQVTDRLVDLFAAITAGESAAAVVDEYFGRARGAPLRWFSVNPAKDSGQEHFAGYTWDDIESYLRERYAQNERLELRGIQFNRADPDLAHFGPIEVVLRADDLPAQYYKMTGKGAYDCSSEAFVVLSLGNARTEADFTSPFGLPW